MPISFTTFYSPSIFNGGLPFAISRSGNSNANHFLVVHAQGYGFQYHRDERRFPILNYSTGTGPEHAPELSDDGHPLIWLDDEADRKGRILIVGGMPAALQEASVPVIRLTGRKKRMRAREGGEREAQEAVILLTEDQLARMCSYCGDIERLSDEVRYERHAGEGYQSLYWCRNCPKTTGWYTQFRRWMGWQ